MNHLTKKALQLLLSKRVVFLNNSRVLRSHFYSYALVYENFTNLQNKEVENFQLGPRHDIKMKHKHPGGSNYCYDLVRTAPSVSAPIALIPKQRRFRTEGHLLFVPF